MVLPAHVWTPHTRCAINKLESVQRRAARFVMSNYSRTSSVTDMLNSLNWNSVETRIKELRLHTLYKIIYECVNLLLPSYPTQATRGNHLKFIQPSTRIDAYKVSILMSYSYGIILPDYIVSAQSLDFFKVLLTNYIN